MNKFLQYGLLLFLLFPVAAKAQFESFKDSVVQLYGVVMTADSLQGIPLVGEETSRGLGEDLLLSGGHGQEL